MLKTKTPAALTALLLLALPSVAQAGEIEHQGTVTGVEGTTVKFVVKKRGGELKQINNMGFVGVPYTCDDDSSGAIRADLPSFRISGKDFTRKAGLEGTGIKSGSLRVAGQFSRGGKRASGEVRFSFTASGGADCGTHEVEWRTRKR